MTKNEVKQAIQRGLGRGYLAVRNDPERYRDLVLWACGRNLATLMLLADVNFILLLSSLSMKALFTNAWQSSNTPSTSMAVIFFPRVVN